jgi:hypothetical protein
MAVLVPHRESRAAARAISAELFAGGTLGAWAFPWVIPLAVLRRSLLREELRTLALRLREKTGEDGKIRSGGEGSLPFPGESPSFLRGLSVYGPIMDLPLSKSLFEHAEAESVIRIFPRAILGCALVRTGESAGGIFVRRAFVQQRPGGISFRAAFAANMSYRPLPGDLSFEWKTGKPAWLPAAKKTGPRVP